MKRLLRLFRTDERGQGLIEYVLIVGVVALCLIAVLVQARSAARDSYNRASTAVSRGGGAGYSAKGVGGGGGGSTPGAAVVPPPGSGSPDSDSDDGLGGADSVSVSSPDD